MKALEAWIGMNLGINPLNLVSVSGDNTWVKYDYPKIGMVFINEKDLFTKNKVLYGKGFVSKKFDIFMKAYNGEGKKPSRSHPILRSFYNKGLKARTRWNPTK